MFYGSRERVRAALHLIQREHCDYDALRFRRDAVNHPPPSRCDCKYGYTGLQGHGEQSGCPELRSAVELLDQITEEEYNTIMQRSTGNVRA